MRCCVLKILIIFFSVNIFKNATEAAEILACLTSASRSHHITQTTILEELARRGHNLTVLSTLPVHKDNLPKSYHHIYLDMQDTNDWAQMRQRMLNNDTKSELNQLLRLPTIVKMVIRRSENVLNHSAVQTLRQSKQNFDLFILGYNFNEVMLGLAGHFHIPSVIISTYPAMKPLRDLIGNPAAVSSTPLFSREGEPSALGMWQRLKLFMEYSVEYIVTTFINYFIMENTYNEHFSDVDATFEDVKKNVSLILVNTHFSEGVVRPALPNLIEIGGIHIGQVSPLPKDFQDIFNRSKDGVILFSFGGNIRISDMANEKIQMFYRVFSRLKQTVIWKWESDEIISGKPDNVYMFKWLPQKDLLAQPQTKLFISHCGIGGIHEAKYHAIPILGIPIYGDQLANAKQIANAGWSLTLKIDALTELELNNSVQELLMNASYKANVQKISQLFRDRPMTPLDTAIFWIEYTIRHNGARHMQSEAVHLNYFQTNSLDVIAVILVAFYTLLKMKKMYIFVLFFAYILYALNAFWAI